MIVKQCKRHHYQHQNITVMQMEKHPFTYLKLNQSNDYLWYHTVKRNSTYSICTITIYKICIQSFRWTIVVYTVSALTTRTQIYNIHTVVTWWGQQMCQIFLHSSLKVSHTLLNPFHLSSFFLCDSLRVNSFSKLKMW